VINVDGTVTSTGPFKQVSRLGSPLVNEVLIPIPMKDKFNSQDPSGDSQFATYVSKPELAGLLPVLYPGAFPNLAKYTKPRADLEAILLTGIPAGVVAGFQNFTGTVQADMLRLNMAIPPTTSKPSNLGLIGMDPAGFPNGRRVFDDVTTIELRAIAGVTLPLVDKTYKPDAAAGAITPGLTSSNTDVSADNTEHYLSTFPYLGTPHDGYTNPANDAPASDLGTINKAPGQVSTVPSGAPNTGIAPAGSSDTSLYVGAGIAAAGAALIGGAAVRRRPQPAPAGGPALDRSAVDSHDGDLGGADS
jgi:hypothetical protein